MVYIGGRTVPGICLGAGVPPFLGTAPHRDFLCAHLSGQRNFFSLWRQDRSVRSPAGQIKRPAQFGRGSCRITEIISEISEIKSKKFLF